MWLQVPLFAGYLFVRLAIRDCLQVLEIPSVVRLVGFNGHPTALPNGEIEALRDGLADQLRAEPHPFLTVGRRVRVLQIPSVVRLVGFGGSPTALPDAEMEILRARLCQSLSAKPYPFLTQGRRVRVRSGPLAGIHGTLLRQRGKARFVVSVELIMRSMAVEMDEADLEAV